MATFHGHAVPTVEGPVVLLKFIESICPRHEDDEIIDKLKGDIVLSIRTISGAEYDVSMNVVHNSTYGLGDTSNEELAIAVVEKWNYIHKP